MAAQVSAPLYAPPGIKVDPQSHIPSNYPKQQQQNQQSLMAQQTANSPVVNSQSQLSGFVNVNANANGQQSSQQHQQQQRTYPPTVHSFPPVHHFQQPPQQPTSQNHQQQQNMEATDLKMDVKSSSPVIDNNSTRSNGGVNKREWNPSPQALQKPTPIDTWTNETANSLTSSQTTSSSYNSRPTSANYRSNRSQPPNLSGRSGMGGSNNKYGGSGSGYNNRGNNNNNTSSHQSAARNNVYQNGNGSGDRMNSSSSPGERGGNGDTFYRNNGGGSRYGNSGNGNGNYGGPKQPRNDFDCNNDIRVSRYGGPNGNYQQRSTVNNVPRVPRK
jgi:hypothetical protein